MRNTLFEWERPTPPEWQDALRSVCPAGEHLSDFRIVWEPGEPQSPVQRWVIWQMRPLSVTRELIARERDPRVLGLTQEHPRAHARWDDVTGSYRKWGGGYAATDRLTWELYRETGQFGTRFWVIQGPRGGHKVSLSAVERKLLGATTDGLVERLPRLGDLDYAPYDARVHSHLGNLEQVALWHRVVQQVSGREAMYDRAEQDAAEVARLALCDWLDRQYAGLWDEYKPVYKQALRDIKATYGTPTNHTPKAGDDGSWQESYIKSPA